MKRFLQRLLIKPVQWLADQFSSSPDKERVHASLDKLYKAILEKDEKKGLIIPFNESSDKFIIFSDQHKGLKNGADDFAKAEKNYLAALEHYFNQGFSFISLGDEEELWENSVWSLPAKNKITNESESRFLALNRFYKIFGNHDILWNNDPLAALHLKRMFGSSFPVYEGLVLQGKINSSSFNIFLTHGHQGDGQSDGNKFSAWFVSSVWAPLQSYLEMNPNTPAANDELKTLHNRFMYEWSDHQKDTLLITGHTHQPVFASLTHLESLYKQLLTAKLKNDIARQKELENEILFRKKEYGGVSNEYLTLKPTYFNSGCCCFNDGDITGIEMEDGMIRLIKWYYNTNGDPERLILEESSFYDIINSLAN